MAVIDFAERRLNEESRAGNDHLVAYWAAYRDGAVAMEREMNSAIEDVTRRLNTVEELMRQWQEAYRVAYQLYKEASKGDRTFYAPPIYVPNTPIVRDTQITWEAGGEQR